MTLLAGSVAVFLNLTGLLIIAALGIVWFYNHWSKKFLSPLLSIIEGEIPDFSENVGVTTLDGVWQGIHIKIEIGTMGGGISSWVFITFNHDFPLSVLRIFPRENEGFMVLSSPEEGFLPWPTFRIKISDEDFKKPINFQSVEEKKIKDFLNARRISNINSIFSNKFNLIEISHDYIKIGITSLWGISGAHRVCREIAKPEIMKKSLKDIQAFIEG